MSKGGSERPHHANLRSPPDSAPPAVYGKSSAFSKVQRCLGPEAGGLLRSLWLCCARPAGRASLADTRLPPGSYLPGLRRRSRSGGMRCTMGTGSPWPCSTTPGQKRGLHSQEGPGLPACPPWALHRAVLPPQPQLPHSSAHQRPLLCIHVQEPQPQPATLYACAIVPATVQLWAAPHDPVCPCIAPYTKLQ